MPKGIDAIAYYKGRGKKRTLAGCFWVDSEHVNKFRGYRWSISKRGYPVRYESGKAIFAHHVVCPLRDGLEVDHRDLNPLNVCESNLRRCTHAQNCANGPLRKTNTSGFRGVSLLAIAVKRKRALRWRALVRLSGKCRTKMFATPVEAARWYDQQAVAMVGEFARLNFPALCPKN